VEREQGAKVSRKADAREERDVRMRSREDVCGSEHGYSWKKKNSQ
jgi:hypothetical protein